jgi:hypothetical protein
LIDRLLEASTQLAPQSRRIVFEYLGTAPMLFHNPKFLSEHVEIKTMENKHEVVISSEPVKSKLTKKN